MPVKLADLIRHKLWLAPLAGYTDKSFRSICRECGADVVVSEMISADGLLYNREKSLEYACFDESQRPFAIQIFGSNADIMKMGAEIALHEKPDILDINMGCPVKKVVKKGAGSALMKNPQEAERIVQTVKNLTAKAGIPLSVKLRAGWDNFSINAVDFGRRMEAAGADLICLHPRTRSQMFSGFSDWNLIAQLKNAIKIPVIGNGDIKDVESAAAMFEQTGCDGVMIGRGALGKPWLFRQIRCFLEEGRPIKIENEEKLRLIRKHIDLTVREIGEDRAMIELRSHFAFYTKGYHNSARVRAEINNCFHADQIMAAFTRLYTGQDG